MFELSDMLEIVAVAESPALVVAPWRAGVSPPPEGALPPPEMDVDAVEEVLKEAESLRGKWSKSSNDAPRCFLLSMDMLIAGRCPYLARCFFKSHFHFDLYTHVEQANGFSAE